MILITQSTLILKWHWRKRKGFFLKKILACVKKTNTNLTSEMVAKYNWSLFLVRNKNISKHPPLPNPVFTTPDPYSTQSGHCARPRWRSILLVLNLFKLKKMYYIDWKVNRNTSHVNICIFFSVARHVTIHMTVATMN